MGRLGAHPQIVSVFDLGEEDGQPFIVTELMGGGDVEGLIEKADDHRLPFERILEIGLETCRGLEFAHEKGIVHRDLKPGNVWLTADGRAKIGDFGLAVAVDRSRLTQAGMMVGTVSYMPPEQAMGGDVGPRSDLYSLGAMLYEMVCGRPPFLGDESVAIIGQHLNAQPVAPSWHRPECPQALEALIMRLLEKDPDEAALFGDGSENGARVRLPRRSGAGRGRSPLRRLAVTLCTGGRSSGVSRSSSSSTGRSMLRFRVRARWRWLSASRGSARRRCASSSRPMWHCGAAGLWLATAMRRGRCRFPTCAFVEAMRSYVLAREPDGLRNDLGSGALMWPARVGDRRPPPRRAAPVRRSAGRPFPPVRGGGSISRQRLLRAAAVDRARGPALG